MTAATVAFTALQDAMTETDPECRDDDRFILDDQPADTLAYICDRCPLINLCRTYAAAERPKGGVWAGRRWHTNTKEQS